MGSDEYSLHILCTTCAVQNILSIFFKHAPEDSVQQHILCISAGLAQHKFSSLGNKFQCQETATEVLQFKKKC